MELLRVFRFFIATHSPIMVAIADTLPIIMPMSSAVLRRSVENRQDLRHHDQLDRATEVRSWRFVGMVSKTEEGDGLEEGG